MYICLKRKEKKRNICSVSYCFKKEKRIKNKEEEEEEESFNSSTEVR